MVLTILMFGVSSILLFIALPDTDLGCSAVAVSFRLFLLVLLCCTVEVWSAVGVGEGGFAVFGCQLTSVVAHVRAADIRD